MKASDLIATRFRPEGVVLLEAKQCRLFTLLGTTFTASVPTGTCGINSFSLVLPEKTDGLLALCITDEQNRQFGFLLTANGGNPEVFGSTFPKVELNHTWVPLADRLGQVVDGALEVIIDGERFTTDPDRGSESGYKHVPDGDVVCRYLLGKVGKDTVTAIVTQPDKESTGE